MTDVVTLGERKTSAKCKQCMLLSAIQKKMPLSGKVCGGNCKDLLPVWTKCHRHCLFTSETMDYSEVHAVKSVWSLIHKFEETGCTCDWFQLDDLLFLWKTVVEVHQTISIVRPASSCSVSRVLHMPNSTVHKILHFILNMFPFRF